MESLKSNENECGSEKTHLESLMYEGGGKSKSSIEKVYDKILVKKDINRFNKSLGQNRLELFKMGGDGNCLFRSVAD